MSRRSEILVKAAKEVRAFFTKAGSSATAKAAARISASGKISPAKLGQLVSENKLTAAFVLYEMGSVGAPILAELAQEDNEVADLLDLIQEGEYTQEEVADMADDVPSADEMATISRGVAVVGSHDRLLDLMMALNVEEKHHINYRRVRELGRTLR